MEKKTAQRFWSWESKIYFIIMLILLLVLGYYNWRIAVAGIAVLVLLFYYNVHATRRFRSEWEAFVENLISTADTAAQKAVVRLPMGIIVMDSDGLVRWYNPYAAEIFPGVQFLESRISEILPEVKPEKVFKQPRVEQFDVRVGNRLFKVLPRVFKGADAARPFKSLAALYLQDITELHDLRRVIEDRQLAVAVIEVDNYEEVLQGTDEANRPVVVAEIEKALGAWAAENRAGLKKFAEDRFLAVFENQSLLNMVENRFIILDRFREIKAGNMMPVTLSIGVGVRGETPADSLAYAHRALDLALGRGGDQAVLKDREKVSFFGGKSKAVEKRTKVKARVIAHALRELIEGSDRVMVVSHLIPDMDSLGAAVGIFKAARSLGRDGYLVFEGANPSLDMIVGALKKDEELSKVFITKEQAARMYNPKTLAVVVDTHRPSFTNCPEEILSGSGRVVVIDHHRRGEEFVANPVLVYLEPYASSTCELVTELLQYIKDDMKLKEIEATALMAGIIMDTKNFAFKTGIRTFEAASYLRSQGADPTFIHRLFQEDMESIVSRTEVVKQAEILYDNIAVSVFRQKIKNPSLFAAQGADALLNLKNVTASFVLCPGDDEVIISGRSLGDINVQVVLEKLGGGGHLTVAGAQLPGVSVEEAFSELKDALEDYVKGGEDV